MPSIYIDTNIYLGFYESSEDRLVVFKEILERADSILLTQQTIDEFLRNRISCLLKLTQDIKRVSSVSMHTTAVVQSLPSFAKWKAAKESAEQAARDISKEISSWTEDDARDAVLAEFLKLADKAVTLPSTEEFIHKAQQRKILGQPPTSPDKHTLGDELIWESILQGAKDDLIVVTRDRSFITNRTLLAAEFKRRTTKTLLLVTTSLTSALEMVGQGSEKVKAAEATLTTLHAPEHYSSVQCPKCGSREFEETGFEGSDGDEAWWLVCQRCGTEVFPE